MNKKVVFIVSQHNQGIGHFSRAAALAEELSKDFVVYHFSGGPSVPELAPCPPVNFIQLPAFSRQEIKLGTLGKPLPEIFAERRQILSDAFIKLNPTIIITELYPFAPHRLEDTLIPLLPVWRASPNHPKIICSLRDIPITSNSKTPLSEKASKINKNLHDFYDLVLYHSDPKVCGVADVPELSEALKGINVETTGYVVRKRPMLHNRDVAPIDLLVTGGGGWDAAPIFKGCYEAISKIPKNLCRNVYFAVGPFFPKEELDIFLQSKIDRDVKIYDGTANIYNLIQRSKSVISMGGQNTTLEAVALGKPLLIVPRNGSFEQIERARLLVKAGVAITLEQNDGWENEFEQAIIQLFSFIPKRIIDVNGAERSRQILLKSVKEG